uniref:Uncharacterized protein n=1 Tax=Rhizophora mucronata TaxID=61149 RepID=A0A2P2L0N4_RHIMU
MKETILEGMGSGKEQTFSAKGEIQQLGRKNQRKASMARDSTKRFLFQETKKKE